VLDELDVFAKRPKQTLLYNLLDALHRSKMQARFHYHPPFCRGSDRCLYQHDKQLVGMLSQVLVDVSCLAQAL